ncbi:hypothetical protein [Pontibacter pamirensis]|uniref:hypothetical protein n=1 Tax=Pontibacter pamirensis TaxID=2562824 RepID=UPI00138A5B8C|nr:hypothetical protein [Pontibacter pamirensis]
MSTLAYDLVVLIVTFFCCLVYNFLLYRHPAYVAKKGFTYLLVFLAMYPLLNMIAHLIAVGTLSVIRWQHGVFQYDIKFYALTQFAVLLILINAYLLSCIKQISRGNWGTYRHMVLACVLQIAIVLPLFPFNPISLLPVATSFILVIRLMLAMQTGRVKGLKLEKSIKGCTTYA